MRLPLRSYVAASLLVVTLLAGCSSSGGSDADATSSTTTVAEAATSSTVADVKATSTTVPDEGTTTTSADGGGDTAICKPLKVISDYDIQVSAALQAQAPWSEVQATFVEKTEEVLAAYDAAIPLADPDVAADIQTLRDFTAPTADLARQAASLTDLGLALAGQPNVMEAGEAGKRLDPFSRETCGFGTSTAGD